jgi:flagellum-specific peptidoglycan hydrolase FlgJ
MKSKAFRDILYIIITLIFVITAIKHLPSTTIIFVHSTHAAVQITPKPTVITPTQTPEPTETVHTTNWENFKMAAHRIARIYNYPANVVIAQAALESSYGSSEYAVMRNNYIGIGAVDSDPDEAFTFENDEQCVIEYMRLVRHNFPEAWDSRNNPDKLINLLESNDRGNYYASDPDYVSKVESMPEWSNE